MIPDIKEILAGLLSGSYDIDQAEAWIYQHIELGYERDAARDRFAAAALPISSALYAEGHGDGREGIARHAYMVADAMMKVRKQ